MLIKIEKKIHLKICLWDINEGLHWVFQYNDINLFMGKAIKKKKFQNQKVGC